MKLKFEWLLYESLINSSSENADFRGKYIYSKILQFISREFFISFHIMLIIAALTPDARMFSQLHILTIL